MTDMDRLVEEIKRGNTVILKKDGVTVKLFICKDWEYPEDKYLVSYAGDFNSGLSLLVSDSTIKRTLELYLSLGYTIEGTEKGRPFTYCD